MVLLYNLGGLPTRPRMVNGTWCLALSLALTEKAGSTKVHGKPIRTSCVEIELAKYTPVAQLVRATGS